MGGEEERRRFVQWEEKKVCTMVGEEEMVMISKQLSPYGTLNSSSSVGVLSNHDLLVKGSFVLM